MKTYFEKYYQENANTFYMYSELQQSQENKIEFALDSREDADALFRLIPELHNDFEEIEKKHGIAPYFRSKAEININDIQYLGIA